MIDFLKDVKESFVMGFCLFWMIFGISVILTTPVAIMFVAALYLDGNL
tara:strand:- start:743 stop:886 length:144 start_codon:yes stop_codon:yes gene_type:complete